MKRLLSIILICCAGTLAVAQDLDTVTITDQFNTGDRGKNNNSSTQSTDGDAAKDGSDFVDYSGTDFSASITTSARYINTWSTGASESPVLTVTSAFENPDRAGINIPGIPANTRPGATDGTKAVVVGDNGGYNALFFGESNDRNYYVQVDMYCPDNSAATGGFEVAGIVARAARDNDTSMTDFTFNPDRAGSYSLFYDYQLKEVKAVRWITGNSTSNIQTRVASTYQLYGSPITNVTTGWHTFKIECKDSKIQFSFDGTIVATVTDTNLFNGRPGLYYRENAVASASEKQGIFDQLKAGPATLVSGIPSWSLY